MIRSIALYVLMLIAVVWVSGSTETVQNDDSCLTEVPQQVQKRLEEMNKKLDSLIQKMNKPKCCVQPVPATAASCKDVLQKAKAKNKKLGDGVYDIFIGSQKMKAYCDMTRDGGGWTLITATRTSYGWTKTNIYERNAANPSLNHDYSILGKANLIKSHSGSKTFQYRIEANGRGRWGGIWSAPSTYSFISTNDRQTSVKLLHRFDSWKYSAHGIQKRMPWIDLGHCCALLSLHGNKGTWWGTLVMKNKTPPGTRKSYNIGPWIYTQPRKGSQFYYWLREN